MTEDIVTRLRQVMSFEGGLNPVVDSLADEAADEIQRLRKEVSILRIEQVLREAGHYG